MSSFTDYHAHFVYGVDDGACTREEMFAMLYTPAASYAAEERSLITLGGTDWVLLEFVPDVTPDEVEAALQQFTRCGYRVLLAHIERYPRLARSGALPRLKEQYGIRCQVNAATVLDGGFFQRRRLDRWLKEGIVDAISSDAHNCSTRCTRMRPAYERLYASLGQQGTDALFSGNGVSLLKD